MKYHIKDPCGSPSPPPILIYDRFRVCPDSLPAKVCTKIYCRFVQRIRRFESAFDVTMDTVCKCKHTMVLGSFLSANFRLLRGSLVSPHNINKRFHIKRIHYNPTKRSDQCSPRIKYHLV